MREIKFRAWDNNIHRFVKCWDMDILDGDLWKKLEDNSVILMQFTGLKDKNGKDIYDGDIVKATSCHQGFIMCVVWDTMDAAWRVNYYNGTKEVQDFLCYYNNLEVIGNIYENSELLKG